MENGSTGGGGPTDHVFWRISHQSYQFAWCRVVRLETIHWLRWTLLGGRWLFLALALWSIWAHALGALWDDGRWNASPNIDLSPHRLWSMGNSPLVEYGKDVFGRAWIAIRRLPTSRSAPALLSAIYQLDSPSCEVVASSRAAQCPVPLCIVAVNTGPSVWLAALGGDKGTVNLEWRWVKEGREVAGFAGAEPLRHDIFPRHSYKFQIPFLHVPSGPGQYVLELEMATGYLGRFSRWGSEPMAIPVTLPTWTPEVLLSYLSSPVMASPNTPKLTLVLDHASYRHGEHLRISYQLAGAEKPVLLDAYLALRQPSGDVALATVSGEERIKLTGCFRSEGSMIYIQKGSRFSDVLNFPLIEGLPPGNYTLYFFLTEAGSYRMLAKGVTTFRLEP